MLNKLAILALSIAFAGSAFAGTAMVETPPEEVGPRYYFSLYGGYTAADDAEETANSGGQRTDLSFDEGGIYGGAIGLRMDGGWRLELDFSHTQTNGSDYVEHFTGGGLDLGPLTGDVSTTSIMFNVAKEFGTRRLRPYVGAGAGLSMVDAGLNDESLTNGDQTVGQSGEFGYQFMGGAVYDVNDRTQAFFEYRASSLSDSSLDQTFAAGGGELDHGWSHHFILGMRIFF